MIAGASLLLVWFVVQNISWLAAELTAQGIKRREANGNDSAGLDAREVRLRKAYAFCQVFRAYFAVGENPVEAKNDHGLLKSFHHLVAAGCIRIQTL